MVAVPVAALDNPVDVLMLLVIAVLIFGKNLPDVARSLGKGIRELKESTNFSEVADAINSVNQVRTAVTPTSILRSTLPGLAEGQDAAGSIAAAADPQPAVGVAEATPAAGAATVATPDAEPSPGAAHAG